MAERITWIDFAKGFAIISVVLGHALDDEFSLCVLIYIFHMPFFFYLGGLSFKFGQVGRRGEFQKIFDETFQAAARAVLSCEHFIFSDLVCRLPQARIFKLFLGMVHS